MPTSAVAPRLHPLQGALPDCFRFSAAPWLHPLQQTTALWGICVEHFSDF